MSSFKKVIIGILLGLVALLGGGTAIKNSNLGSVVSTGIYQSTTTSQAGFAGRQVTLVSDSPCTLGSVIVSSTTPALPTTGTLRIMNATSTTDVSSTTLASFPIQPTAGTYTFDTFAGRGCIVEVGVGFNGIYTITTRP
jgi:hypothetical protein